MYTDIKDHFEETKQLAGKSVEEKWEYVFGAELYSFLLEAKKIIPDYESISFESNLDERKKQRAIYFLYPRRLSSEGKFILVYRYPFTKDEAQAVIFTQDKNTYIIKNQ